MPGVKGQKAGNRKPTVLKIRDGNPGCREIKPEVQPTGKASPTRELTGPALEWWNRTVPLISEMGLATAADSDYLTLAAEAWAWVQEAHEAKKITVWNTALHKYISLTSRFGMSPADRVGLMPTVESSKDKTAKYLG